MTESPRECDAILTNIMCSNNICKLHTPKCNNLQQKNGGRGDVQLGHLAVQHAAPSRLHRRRQWSQRRRPRSCKQRLLRNGPDAEQRRMRGAARVADAAAAAEAAEAAEAASDEAA